MVILKQFRRTLELAFIAALGLLGSVAGAYAQGAGESVAAERFGHSYGLMNEHTRALAQTPDGYLWVGTTTGLYRFDGRRFEPFSSGDFPGLKDHYIRALATDTTGALWILHREGVARMDPSGVRAVLWRHGAPIDQLAGFGDGIAFTSGSNFYTANFERVTNVAGLFPEAFDTSKATGIASDGKRLLMASENGKWAELAWGKPGIRHGSISNALGSAKVVVAGVSTGGTNLFGCEAGKAGILLAAGPEGPVVEAGFGPNTGRRNKLTQLSSGEIAALHASSGLARLGNAGVEGFAFALHDTVHSDEGEGVVDFFEDRDGTLWLAGDYFGVYKLRRAVAVSTIGSGVQGLESGARAVLAVEDGSVLGGGNAVFLARFPEVSPVVHTAPLTRPSLEVRSMALSSDGTLWMGTGTGLMKKPRNGATQKVDLSGDPQGKIYAILEARDGAMWFGSPHGLHMLDGDAHWFSAQTENGFAFDTRHLLEDRHGVIWAATRGGGLARREGGIWNFLTKADGLQSDIFWHLYEDGDGDLWAAGDAGVQVLRDGRPEMSFTTANKGLPFEEVHTVIEDDWGRIWMSSDVGIASAMRRDMVSHHFGQIPEIPYQRISDSFTKRRLGTNGKYSSPGVAKAADGSLWYAGTTGLIRVDPRPGADRVTLPDVALEGVRVGNETVHKAFFPESIATRAKALGGRVPSVAAPRSWLDAVDLLFQPGFGRSLEFHIAGIDLRRVEPPALQYRLRGFDLEWRDLGESGSALYDNLRPEGYSLEARARASDGHWGPARTLARVTLRPFYYETGWFMVVCGLAAAGILGSIHAWRASYLRKLHELRELRLLEKGRREREAALSRQREIIAKNLHDDAGAAMLMLQHAIGSAKIRLGDGSAEMLDNIQGAADQLCSDMRHLMWHINPTATTLENLLLLIMSQGEQVLGGSGARLLRSLPDPSHLRVAPSPRASLYYACKEIFTNIARHSGASEARFTASLDASTLTVLIEDDGRGFPGQQSGPKPSAGPSGGMGTGNIRERLQSLGGAAEQLASETFPQGAAWRLTIPLAALSAEATEPPAA